MRKEKASGQNNNRSMHKNMEITVVHLCTCPGKRETEGLLPRKKAGSIFVFPPTSNHTHPLNCSYVSVYPWNK